MQNQRKYVVPTLGGHTGPPLQAAVCCGFGNVGCEIVVGVAAVLSADALDDIDWCNSCHTFLILNC